MVEYIVKDLLQCDCNFICHQVNCMGVMGAGIAKQLRTKYPEIYEVYKRHCSVPEERKKDLLGGIDVSTVADHKSIVNLYAQYGYGRNRRQTDYAAFKFCLENVKHYMEKGDTIAFPYLIGCGLAGGDWSIVEDIIKNVFDNSPYHCYICRRPI